MILSLRCMYYCGVSKKGEWKLDIKACRNDLLHV